MTPEDGSSRASKPFSRISDIAGRLLKKPKSETPLKMPDTPILWR